MTPTGSAETVIVSGGKNSIFLSQTCDGGLVISGCSNEFNSFGREVGIGLLMQLTNLIGRIDGTAHILKRIH